MLEASYLFVMRIKGKDFFFNNGGGCEKLKN